MAETQTQATSQATDTGSADTSAGSEHVEEQQTEQEQEAQPEPEPEPEPKPEDKGEEESKPESDDKDKAEEDAGEDDKDEAKPESYEFKLPDGVDVDGKVLETFAAAARDANLTQDAAQKLMETVVSAWAARDAEVRQERQAALIEEWSNTTAGDKEIGGSKLDENMARARAVFQSYGTPALATLLHDTGMATHPELIRWALRVSKDLGEDTFVGGGTPPTPAKTRAERLRLSKSDAEEAAQ